MVMDINDWKNSEEFSLQTREIENYLKEISKKNIISTFDYKSVHSVMNVLNWQWVTSMSPTGIPTIAEIKQAAEEILENTIDAYIDKRKDKTICFPYIGMESYGGFESELFVIDKNDTPKLCLKFVIKTSD
jgi:hypothetical protein